MWSSDFDDLEEELPKKRRKIEPKTKKTTAHNALSEPERIEDLATHSKKVEEVRNWLEFAGQSPAILLITGPAGCAKTTTFKITAKNLGFNIQEWVNPVDKIEFDSSNWTDLDTLESTTYREPKQADKFESFIFRSSRYNALCSTPSRRIILVEDFPNYFLRAPTTFHEFLSKYSSLGHCPIVFICTDDDKLNLTLELFPNHLRYSLQLSVIKFNPIAPTCLVKVLKKGYPSLSKSSLDQIAKASHGDLRAALAQIEFSSSKSCKTGAVTLSKDVTLDYYQNLGRVLYPKRSGQISNDGKLFVHNVQEIADQYNDTFLTMLQENFLDTFGNLQDVIKGCTMLSDTDLFVPHGDDLKPYAALSCVTGLMCANKNVKKGKFKPMERSRWKDLVKQSHGQGRNRYPEFFYTSRTLNLDIIPYMKSHPNFVTKLSSNDADRLRSVKSVNCKWDTFKVPKPVTNLKQSVEEDDEMIIEEFDD